MKKAMDSAPLGDDGFREDQSINALEKRLAQDFGKEDGLFCPSGTMANQLAIKVHTQPGDQVICSWAAHVYNYEGGGMAFHSGATSKLLDGAQGLFKAENVQAAILKEETYHPRSRLVVIEDTSNKGGGAIWDHNEIKKIRKVSAEKGLSMHLDGARLYNRLIAAPVDKKEYASSFDSMSLCLSKGLGAPVGSVLLGDEDFIHQARRIRKIFGGGMRQAGILAAAGTYALDHHVERLAEDHHHAQSIAIVLKEMDIVEEVLPADTNIVIFHLKKGYHADAFVVALAEEGVMTFAIGQQTVRFVLHLDISSEDVKKVIACLKKMKL